MDIRNAKGGGSSYQVVCHGVDVSSDLLPSAFETSHIGLAAKYAFDADISCDPLYLIAEAVESIHHVVDGILEDEYFTSGFDIDLSAHVSVGDGLRNAGDTADLLQHIQGLAGTNHSVHVPLRVLWCLPGL